jgi:gluconokinase
MSDTTLSISPSIVFIIGPSASGKTTIGEGLANLLNWKFEDADTYHSEDAKQKMRDKQSLTDADRVPWLARIQNAITQYRNEKIPVIFACSALKKSYRLVLNGQLAPSAILQSDSDLNRTSVSHSSTGSNTAGLTKEGKSIPVYFLLLKASFDTLYKRLEERKNHYFPPQLLRSQLDALEVPDNTELVRPINAEQAIEDTVNECLNQLKELTSIQTRD